MGSRKNVRAGMNDGAIVRSICPSSDSGLKAQAKIWEIPQPRFAPMETGSDLPQKDMRFSGGKRESRTE